MIVDVPAQHYCTTFLHFFQPHRYCAVNDVSCDSHGTYNLVGSTKWCNAFWHISDFDCVNHHGKVFYVTDPPFAFGSCRRRCVYVGSSRHASPDTSDYPHRYGGVCTSCLFSQTCHIIVPVSQCCRFLLWSNALTICERLGYLSRNRRHFIRVRSFFFRPNISPWGCRSVTPCFPVQN